MMRKVMKVILLAGLAALLWGGAAAGETRPVTMAELEDFGRTVRELAMTRMVLNDPAAEDAESEDGIGLQFDFGVVYADRGEMAESTRVDAFLVMDEQVPAVRGIAIDWEVNRIMEAIPCDNPRMDGTYQRALLYLTGDMETGYAYGLVERDGQRIRAMEYGAADPAGGKRLAMSLQISGDGVDAIRMEGMETRQDAESLSALYEELTALGGEKRYSRVRQSLDGSTLDMFQESDLDFSALSYQTAVPEIFGDNVEDVLIDNDDGTWLRRVDGEGFSAVFTCDERGREAELISYTILSPDLEGPRAVRLGDLFHEDLQRFRNGEGEINEDGTREVLYGREGVAPYGLAEYGNGDEMILRYVTDTLSGRETELLLRYENTVLTEITVHTL
ncbi:MAG: hypothetical protein IKE24_05120 [Clostridia bacterium]|nr:hypothetical protein [Clostridia bacterium]